MKHPTMHSRRARYGGLTVALTVTLVAAVVLLNVIFSTLAGRYAWYIDMTPEHLYSVSDDCHELLEDAITRAESENGKDVRVNIIFAEDYTKYEPGSVGSYIYNTARELAERYDQIELEWFDCWVDKTRAEQLGVRNAQSVVLQLEDGGSRTFFQQEFFTFTPGNTTSPIGYDGERVFATTLVSLLEGERPLCCFTINHDERFFDEALLYLLRDAGYDVTMLDLYYEDIPEDCELLLTYNPSTDFITVDGVSDKSELDKLDAYLAKGGNYMVFLSGDTPVLQNLDTFLAEWGVKVARDYDEVSEREYGALIKDTSTALSADGFTLLGRYTTEGKGAALTADMTAREYVPGVVFRDATALLPSDGFTSTGNATYTCGNRVRSDVFTAGEGAIAWANGKQISLPTDVAALLSVTEDEASGARVLVSGSTGAFAQEYVQSAVFGNADVLLCALRDMGQEHVLVGLHYKPFSSSVISSITSTQKLNWTLTLTLAPIVICAACGVVILVRRRYS
jgi:hypothetical protein